MLKNRSAYDPSASRRNGPVEGEKSAPLMERKVAATPEPSPSPAVFRSSVAKRDNSVAEVMNTGAAPKLGVETVKVVMGGSWSEASVRIVPISANAVSMKTLFLAFARA